MLVVSVTDEYVFLLLIFGIGTKPSSTNHLYWFWSWSNRGYWYMFSILSKYLIFNLPSLEVTMPNNFKWSEKCCFLLFTSKPNNGYERNEDNFFCLVKLLLFALVLFPIVSYF